MTDATPPKPFRRLAFRALALGLLLIVAALAAGAWRLAAGPVELPASLVERIEARADPSGRLSLGGAAVAWDGAEHALRLVVRDAALAALDGEDALRLPRLRVAVDGPSLLRRTLRPREVVLEGLRLRATRDAAGRIGLGLGPGGPPPFSTLAEAEAALDALLARPVLSALEEVRVEGLSLLWSDAVTGVEERAEGGALALRRDDGLTLDGAIPVAGGRVTLAASRGGGVTEATAGIEGLPVTEVARWLPGIPALGVLSGTASAEIGASLEAGRPGPLTLGVALADGGVTADPALAFDRLGLRASWRPGSRRVAVEALDLRAPGASGRATGQVLLGDRLGDPMVAQADLSDLVLDPSGLLGEALPGGGARFDRGGATARLDPRALRIELGEAWVEGPSGAARAAGRVIVVPEGLRGRVRGTVPRMAVADLLALWPEAVAPQARRWLSENVLEGMAVDAEGRVRLVPGAPPAAAAGFGIEEARVRFMRHLPPAEAAFGYATLADGRFGIRVDAASVPAAGGGALDIAGTRLLIPDVSQRPGAMEIDLTVRGAVPDLLRVLDNRPFLLLERMDREPDLAAGRAEVTARVRTPLGRGIAPADVAYEVAGVLRGVTSTAIVPGRTLAADRLDLSVTPDRVRIAGRASLDGVAADAAYEQPLPPPATEPGGPDAPARPLAMPPGRVTGTARVGAEELRRLGVSIPGLEVSGQGAARFELMLRRGAAPRLSVRGDLAGLAASLPVVGWRKGRESAGRLSLEADLGRAVTIDAVALEAPGLSATGRVALGAGGALREAAFDQVSTGWFTGPVTLTGRGAGAAPAVTIGGGRADLIPALDALGGDGGSGGDGGPIDLRLDRLTLSEGVALEGMRAGITTRGGVRGRFSGRLNGTAAVEGVLAPDADGTAVQVETGDLGAVLRAAGLVEGARGGSARLVMRPEGAGYRGQVTGTDLTVRDAPALASLLQALSVVGLLEQLSAGGLVFSDVDAQFGLRDRLLTLTRASAVGPAMSITAQGRYDARRKVMDMEGVVSPIYFVNGLFGALFSRRDEGLFGFTYTMRGASADPQVSVNPLSILTPGVFREIFRRPPPTQ
ncbi:hypothetical protein JQC91_11300 [Jannaschia sp. Os4]|uniref:AsmA-like C-terminal region-containing protein n=1 Tax=Jannaschia sp. Os4 TaxID=2807617 RepID=UPI001939F1FF|nr:AsmA-like C-terminal region-containing protein [Jannaschia sp. Os4]MBM2576886.1 hypothetical protein [Jannaschia sp. Os4]